MGFLNKLFYVVALTVVAVCWSLWGMAWGLADEANDTLLQWGGFALGVFTVLVISTIYGDMVEKAMGGANTAVHTAAGEDDAGNDGKEAWCQTHRAPGWAYGEPMDGHGVMDCILSPPEADKPHRIYLVHEACGNPTYENDAIAAMTAWSPGMGKHLALEFLLDMAQHIKRGCTLRMTYGTPWGGRLNFAEVDIYQRPGDPQDSFAGRKLTGIDWCYDRRHAYSDRAWRIKSIEHDPKCLGQEV